MIHKKAVKNLKEEQKLNPSRPPYEMINLYNRAIDWVLILVKQQISKMKYLLKSLRILEINHPWRFLNRKQTKIRQLLDQKKTSKIKVNRIKLQLMKKARYPEQHYMMF